MIDDRATTYAVHLPPRRSAFLRTAAWVAAALMILALAAPVEAGKPIRGCSDEKVLMSRVEFRALSASLGVPEDLLGEAWVAGWMAYDKNGDDYLCIKDVPNTPGHLDTWVFNVVDNTSNH